MLRGGFRSRYRCGAVPGLHRIPLSRPTGADDDWPARNTLSQKSCQGATGRSAWAVIISNQRAVNLTIIRKLLSPELLAQLNARLAHAKWVDGLATAGQAAARVKRNLQLESGPEAQELAELVKKALLANDKFPPLALPRRLTPPMFSRYEVGMEYGAHTDDAVRSRDGIRTDLAGTLFLSEPESYDGGELVVNSSAVKPGAGDLVLYPATTVHRVAPVTRGVRLAAVFWVQSLVRSHEQRELLLALHGAIARLGDHPVTVSVEAVQQNLLRMWAEP